MMENKRNKPWNVVDEFGKEHTIWESRSMASALFIFTKDVEGHWRVLASKRGSGCPDYQGYWCCPCGYLDYNETLRNAAYRECKEETGVKINELDIHFYKYSDQPCENRQNVTAIHYAVVKNGLSHIFSKTGNEPNEVDDIGWISVDEASNYKWAFEHDEIIDEILNMRIKLPWWKKMLLKLYDKYLEPSSYKEKIKIRDWTV